MKPLSPLLRRLTPLLVILACLAATPAHGGTCSSPAGKEADIKYNSAYHTYQFCNGTNWIAYQWGTTFLYQVANNPTIPGGSGFFVLSYGTYTGNLGGRSGANSTCLTDLTTNTGWQGYSTANANGQLISAKVFAYLCDNSTCTNFNASTNYYFANAINSTAGGAYFTSNSSGYGFGDNATWGAANYFGGTYNFWTGRIENTSSTTTANAAAGTACSSWSTASSGNTGEFGYSTTNGVYRWGGGNSYGDITQTCNNSYHLICFVNP
jgi:hypothetical protein